MRSVFFHLIGVTRQAVAERISSFATPNGLYVGFYNDLVAEAEPGDLEALTASLGMMPSVTVMVDISGRIPGDAEVREFAAFILTEFHGVAWDDYTCHCWTLSEIQSGAKAGGHAFFDYQGWYDEEHKQV